MSLLRSVLSDPRRLEALTAVQWDELLRLARNTRLSSKLHYFMAERGTLNEIPRAAREVLSGAAIFTEYMQLLVRRELDTMNALFVGADFPVVLLKGAAYLMSGLPAADGRRMNDIDLLVPSENLAEMEALLTGAGWAFDEELTDYDQRYYRDWSHELPPMRHANSPLELDVHHNLIQVTGRIRLDSSLLFDDLVPVDGTVYKTLSPLDMVLHSATHLFMSDELRGGLRDLLDMHILCNHFYSQDARYWEKLAGRAGVLGLQRPLYYAAAAMRRNLGTPIPDEAWRQIGQGRPVWPVDRLMSRTVDQHLVPENIARPQSPLAERLLYLRSHWIRMPPLMLARHLTAKWWMGLREAPTNK